MGFICLKLIDYDNEFEIILNGNLNLNRIGN